MGTAFEQRACATAAAGCKLAIRKRNQDAGIRAVWHFACRPLAKRWAGGVHRQLAVGSPALVREFDTCRVGLTSLERTSHHGSYWIIPELVSRSPLCNYHAPLVPARLEPESLQSLAKRISVHA